MKIEKVVVSVTIAGRVTSFEFTESKKLEALFKERSTLGEAVREAFRRETAK